MPLLLSLPHDQVIDVDTSSSMAEIRVSEAVVNRILLRYVDKKTNEVGACGTEIDRQNELFRS